MDLAARTDRLRLEFMAAELDLSFTFVHIARCEFECRAWEHGQQSLTYAGSGRDVIQQMLADPKHCTRLTEAQFESLNQQLEKLQGEIEHIGQMRAAA